MIDILLIILICIGGGAAALLSRRQPKLWAAMVSNLKWELLPKLLKWLIRRR
jgi:hypothetical protein